jgi:hypothetical protein
MDAIIFRVGTVEDELPMEVEGGHQVKVLPESRVVSLQASASGRRRAVTHNSFVHCHRNFRAFSVSIESKPGS